MFRDEVQELLNAWRVAERAADAAEPGSIEEAEAREDARAARDAYHEFVARSGQLQRRRKALDEPDSETA